MNNQKIKELEEQKAFFTLAAQKAADEIAKLKAKPEVSFKKGELLELFGESGKFICLDYFDSKEEGQSCKLESGNYWSNCKKLDVLPINFTPWGDGDGVVRGPVVILHKDGRLSASMHGEHFMWGAGTGIIKYQRIEIL